jgi:hypothetical protein
LEFLEIVWQKAISTYSDTDGAGGLEAIRMAQDGDAVVLKASKLVVASRLNLTPEHFSRILHDLSEQRLISVQGREITVPSVERSAATRNNQRPRRRKEGHASACLADDCFLQLIRPQGRRMRSAAVS